MHPTAKRVSAAFIIAEAGVSHDGSVEHAIALVDAASESGADAVKFQTFCAEKLASRCAPRAAYQDRATGAAGENQLAMLKALELPPEAFKTIAERCGGRGIEFLSTPFDLESVRLLEEIGVERFKIGSGDLTNHPLLHAVGRCGCPVILSTGTGADSEIGDALDALETAGSDVTILHCISRYPAPAEDLQLLRIPALEARFGRPVGYSDHSIGIEAALGARALGASVIEKHFTLDTTLPGPDHTVSAAPDVFRQLVEGVRRLELMLGSSERTFHPEEIAVRDVVRKSVVATRPIRSGEMLSPQNVGVLRPGTGIPPRHWEEVLGRRVVCDIAEGEPLAWEQLH